MRLFYTVRPVWHDKNARARRTIPQKWPPRTVNKSLRDSPHSVRLGQSMDLSMTLKVASSSPPTLGSHLSQLNLVCAEWSHRYYYIPLHSIMMELTYHSSKFKLAKRIARVRLLNALAGAARGCKNATFCDSKGYTNRETFTLRKVSETHAS